MESLLEFCRNTIIIGGALLMFLSVIMILYVFAILGKIRRMINNLEYTYISLTNLSIGDIVNFVLSLIKKQEKKAK